MIALEYSNFVWLALLTVPISWMVPRSFAFDAVALWSAIVVLLLSPPTLIWLGLIAVCVSSLLHDSPDRGRGFMTGLICFFLIGGLIAARSLPTFAWLGGAFFTLRALHVARLVDGNFALTDPAGVSSLLFLSPRDTGWPYQSTAPFFNTTQTPQMGSSNVRNGLRTFFIGRYLLLCDLRLRNGQSNFARGGTIGCSATFS